MDGFKPNAKMGNTGHYSHGGAVMKKAKGGIGRGEGAEEESGTLRMEKMPSGAQQYVRGSTRPEKFQTLIKQTGTQIDKMIPGSDDFSEQGKKANKLLDAIYDNSEADDKEKIDDIIKKMKKAKGGQIMKKANGGAMNAKRIANPNMPRKPMVSMPRPKGGGMMGGPIKPKGGMAMGYAEGGMPMVMKGGKKVPSFAADGKGKMSKGGMAKGKK